MPLNIGLAAMSMLKRIFFAYPFIPRRESQFMWKRWTSPWLKPDFMWELSPTGRDERANRRILDDFTNKVDFVEIYKL